MAVGWTELAKEASEFRSHLAPTTGPLANSQPAVTTPAPEVLHLAAISCLERLELEQLGF